MNGLKPEVFTNETQIIKNKTENENSNTLFEMFTYLIEKT